MKTFIPPYKDKTNIPSIPERKQPSQTKGLRQDLYSLRTSWHKMTGFLAKLIILLIGFQALEPISAMAQIASTTELVSKNSVGIQGNSISTHASISADFGRFVAFESRATNLVFPDTNGEAPDVYVYDRETDEITRVSDINEIDSFPDISYIWPLDSPAMSPSISADGRYIVHTAWVNSWYGPLWFENRDVKAIFLIDRETDEMSHITRNSRSSFFLEGPNRSSFYPSVARDRHFVFASDATVTDLSSRDDNGHRDIFDSFLVSLNSDTAQQANNDSDKPSISADSHYAVFQSAASNLIPGDMNNHIDIFRVDLEDFSNMHLFATAPPSIRWGRPTDLISVSSAGMQGNNKSHSPSISEDGAVTAFVSDATNLVPDDTNGWADILVRDITTERTTRVSVSSTGAQTIGGHSWSPSISLDGNYIAFISASSNLVEGDTNNMSDIFLHNRLTGETLRVSVDSSGNQANGHSYNPSISSNGEQVYVAFESEANNLISNDTNNATDVFVYSVYFEPIANAGINQIVNEGEQVILSGSGSSGAEPLSYSWQQTAGPAVIIANSNSIFASFTAPTVSPVGVDLKFELSVNDGEYTDTDDVAFHVKNINDPPNCSDAVPSKITLWPPNHKMVEVTIENLTDPQNDFFTVTTIAVTQDEPTIDNSDGNTSPDAVVLDQQSPVMLRAERAGEGNGRVYAINFVANDGFESCTGVISVSVPHTLKSKAIDDGQVFDSM